MVNISISFTNTVSEYLFSLCVDLAWFILHKQMCVWNSYVLFYSIDVIAKHLTSFRNVCSIRIYLAKYLAKSSFIIQW